MYFFPIVTTFGRTGIVVRTLQETEEVDNPDWAIGILGVAIAISYWALFSGYTVGYLSDQLVKRNLLASTVTVSGAEIKSHKQILQSNKYTNFFGKFGYLSGSILAVSEGALNFLGTRHLFILLQSKNYSVNFFFPLLFGFSSMVCWNSMVAPKAEAILRGQSPIFSHDDNKLSPRKRAFRTLFGGFTGLIAGLGLAATVTYGILLLIDLSEKDKTNKLSAYDKLIIASPFMFFSALSASLFYMTSNSKLVSEVFVTYPEIFKKIGRFFAFDDSFFNISKKLLRLSLCALVILGGAYATYTLSYVSIEVTLLAFVNLLSQEKEATELPSYFTFFKLLSSFSLAFTATAVSGREGCRFIMSKRTVNDTATIPYEQMPLLFDADKVDGLYKNQRSLFWCDSFYRSKIAALTKSRLIKEGAESSLSLDDISTASNAV